MIAYGPAPTVSLTEARASTAKRMELDVERAASLGMDHGEFTAFMDRLALFDARTPAWEACQTLREREAVLARREAVEWTRAGMIARCERVIADLVDQLAESGHFEQREAA